MLILIAGKQAALRSALKNFLQRRPGLEIAGTAANKAELMSLVTADSSDLLLLDENLAEDLVQEVIIPLRQIDSCPLVIVLGSRTEMSQVYRDAGVESFVSKSTPPKSLLTMIEEIRLRGDGV